MRRRFDGTVLGAGGRVADIASASDVWENHLQILGIGVVNNV